ncbi:hypothetical protein AUC69_00850 [Methyloceanibacter superfactus]|jgi:hypothetical protein|uniref:Uncharacterized protein n=1 Tax=Methyloceanibacter superfactus TaxID=1774969 RepID=A0A1E3W3Q7_9HYPH|nr:hypothetical protein [Methyloceanibacter superfactus]ODS00448.1 hypothetical protein AUC69_00850 [Methyloceanibacter superfactus]
MDAIAHALADPGTRSWYLIGCLALLALPMAALAIWFHRGIKQSSGGRALMRRQRGARTWARGSLADAAYNAGDGVSIMQDIRAGRYGQHAKAMMTRVYWITGAWVLLNTIAFGILIWADEINRVVE